MLRPLRWPTLGAKQAARATGPILLSELDSDRSEVSPPALGQPESIPTNKSTHWIISKIIKKKRNKQKANEMDFMISCFNVNFT